MQTIRIGVIRGRPYRSVDGFQVYGDEGTGQMDWTRPVTSRRQLLWPDGQMMPGHLFVGHLMAQHLDAIRPDGHLEGTHLMDDHLYPAALVEYETDPFVFGRFQHAVVTEDAVGNSITSGVTVFETVINSEPASPREFKPAAHDVGLGRFSFSFVPSERLVG